MGPEAFRRRSVSPTANHPEGLTARRVGRSWRGARLKPREVSTRDEISREPVRLGTDGLTGTIRLERLRGPGVGPQNEK